jgi:sugar lactone lactonase YvrE
MPFHLHHIASFAFSLIAVVAAGLFTAAQAAAQLVYPQGIAVRGESEIFVADLELHGIWKIEGGSCTTYFQGTKQFRTPFNRPRAVAVDAQANLLAGCSATREVYRFDSDNQPVPLTSGGVGNPMGIAVNKAGEILVSDQELHRIWKVPAAGGTAETFVEVPGPRGICIDGEDRLWVVSGREDKGSLVRVSPDKEIEIIVSGREFKFPLNVAVDGEGAAYVSDNYAATVWKIEPGGKPAAWAKGEPLKSPTGLAWQGKSLLVTDPLAKAVFRIDAEGKAESLELK